MEPRVRKPSLVLFAMVLVLYTWPMDFDHGPNVIAHVDQAFAIASSGTLAIDHFMKPQPNTTDWALAPDGRYYPAKAPGAALFAVPVTWVLYQLERRAGFDPLDPEWFRRNMVIINWVMNAVISAGAMVLLFHLALSVEISPRAAMLGTIAVGLGTAYYPYATAYYAHVPAANAILAAVFLIFSPTARARTDVIAGLCAGTAVLFDYPAVFAVAALAGAILSLRPRALLPYIAGGCVALGALLWYNLIAFGSPFKTAYAYQNPMFATSDGSFVNMPNLEALASITVTPYRGVFVYSPAIVLGLVGAWHAWKDRSSLSQHTDRRRRTLAVVAVVTFGLWLLLNASYHTWWGGYTAGPRFIIPALILFGPFIALGVQRYPRTGLVLIAAGMLNYFAITAVEVVLSEHIVNPLRDAIYPRLILPEFGRSNIGLFLGLPGHWSLLPPLVIALLCGASIWRSTKCAAPVYSPPAGRQSAHSRMESEER